MRTAVLWFLLIVIILPLISFKGSSYDKRKKEFDEKRNKKSD